MAKNNDAGELDLNDEEFFELALGLYTTPDQIRAALKDKKGASRDEVKKPNGVNFRRAGVKVDYYDPSNFLSDRIPYDEFGQAIQHTGFLDVVLALVEKFGSPLEQRLLDDISPELLNFVQYHLERQANQQKVRDRRRTDRSLRASKTRGIGSWEHRYNQYSPLNHGQVARSEYFQIRKTREFSKPQTIPRDFDTTTGSQAIEPATAKPDGQSLFFYYICSIGGKSYFALDKDLKDTILREDDMELLGTKYPVIGFNRSMLVLSPEDSQRIEPQRGRYHFDNVYYLTELGGKYVFATQQAIDLGVRENITLIGGPRFPVYESDNIILVATVKPNTVSTESHTSHFYSGSLMRISPNKPRNAEPNIVPTELRPVIEELVGLTGRSIHKDNPYRGSHQAEHLLSRAT